MVDIVVERRRRDNVILRRGGDVPQQCYWLLLRHRWVFHLRLIWDFGETYWWALSLRLLETSSRHTNKRSWRRSTEMSWQRSTETSLGVSFETYLQSHWDVQTVATTSCCLMGTNLNQYLTYLCLINLYFTNLRQIQSALIRTQ